MRKAKTARPPGDAPPIDVAPTRVELPDAALGETYDVVLDVATRGGGRLRVKPSSDRFRVVERPKHALAPGASCRVVLRYSPADPNGNVAAGHAAKIFEHVEIISQHSAVRVPVTGTVVAGAE